MDNTVTAIVGGAVVLALVFGIAAEHNAARSFTMPQFFDMNEDQQIATLKAMPDYKASCRTSDFALHAGQACTVWHEATYGDVELSVYILPPIQRRVPPYGWVNSTSSACWQKKGREVSCNENGPSHRYYGSNADQ
jgi:hypothetical protein